MDRAEPLNPAAPLAVEVVYSPAAAQVDAVALSVPQGTTVGQAIALSGLPSRHPDTDFTALRCGVWGKLREADEMLRDRDRVEVYRPLTVDPKEARRLRYRQHLERFGRR